VTKVCNRCKGDKEWSEFRLRSTGRPYAYCKPCQNDYDAERQKKLRHEDPAYAFEWEKRNKKRRISNDYEFRRNLRRHYSMTMDQYDAILKSQGGVCVICQQECNTGRRLAVDHSHETGSIRGLLCGNCNKGLGMFKDSIKLLENAIKYLQEQEV